MTKMSHEDFLAHVDFVRRQLPDHPLLPQLGTHSRMAEIYLQHALRALPKEAARTQVQSADEEPIPDSPEWDDLQKRKSQLYGRRANLSNQFHDVQDNPIACANISDEIRIIQRKIGKVQRQIAHYRRTGELIEEAPEVAREYTGVALSRRVRTVQQNANRWRKRIEREGPTTDDSTVKKWDEKLKKYERELEELKGQLRQEAV